MLFGYDLDVDTGVGVAHVFNDALAADIRRFPDRFWGAAQLPMQDPQMATEELERAVRELDLHSALDRLVLRIGADRGPPRL